MKTFCASLADTCRRGACKTETTWMMDLVTLVDRLPERVLIDDYLCSLHRCKDRKDLELIKQVHASIRESGLETNPNIGNHLVPALVECGSILNAQHVFDKLAYRNMHSWTSMIIGHIRQGDLINAVQLYEEMQADGVAPSCYALTSVLKACTLLRDVQKGIAIHKYIVGVGVEKNLIIGSSLIDMYAKSSLLPEAHIILDRLPNKNVVVWSALIAGYVENEQGWLALKCFEQMQEEGVFPNPVTFISVLKACGGIGLVDKGRHMHSQIIYQGLENELFIGNTLINMYSKCGLLRDAYDTFEKLAAKDVGSWNAIIQGCSMNDDGKLSLYLFECMHLHDVKPDAITFACALSACGRANMVAKGREIFTTMSNVYRIAPMIDHFTCMVDLLARAGQLYEAQKLLESSPYLPPDDMCRALLSSYIKYAGGDIRKGCVHRLV